MAFFNSAVDVLQTLVIALGAGLGIWGVINLLEGYGQDNPASKSQGMKQLMAGGGVALIKCSFTFPCDPESWVIAEDPLGMAAKALNGEFADDEGFWMIDLDDVEIIEDSIMEIKLLNE
jgi:hypothetical protein